MVLILSVFVVLENTLAACDCGLLSTALGLCRQCQLLYHNWCCVWWSWWITGWPAVCCTGDTQLVCFL